MRDTHTPGGRAASWLALVFSAGAALVSAAGRDASLVAAARNQDLQTVRARLAQRADVNSRADDGSTALLWAAHWNDVPAADLLIRGSLLDHVMLLVGSGISNSDRHTHGPLPTLLLGGGGGLQGGHHLIVPEDTPLTNLQLTLLNRMGIPAEKPGDSTGQFNELSGLSSRSA